jgi:hypothetical protein
VTLKALPPKRRWKPSSQRRNGHPVGKGGQAEAGSGIASCRIRRGAHPFAAILFVGTVFFEETFFETICV